MAAIVPASVLWLDDLPDTVAGLRMELESTGVTVIAVEDLDSASNYLKNNAVNLVLIDMDLGLSGGRGDELLFQLQDGQLGDLNRDIPVAAFSAFYSAEGLIAPRVVESGQFLGAFSKHSDLGSFRSRVLDRLVSVDGLAEDEVVPAAKDLPPTRELLIQFRAISDEVIKELASRPERLYEFSPRQFEELTAEIFERSGFSVTLTPSSGDRGVDIYAARSSDLGTLLYVVECKRYALNRPVGPSLVRQLRGVVDRERASCGVLVTTSSFTPGAMREQQTSPHTISLRDFDDLTGWLRGGISS